jgi:hypothetical protein
VSLLERVAAVLHERRIPFAVIGAAAVSVHGVPRAAPAIEVLVADTIALSAMTWEPLQTAGIGVVIHRGDTRDPYVGVAHLADRADGSVDVLVGRAAWQSRVLDRATPRALAGTVAPVATAADIILLKLYAGGPQDTYDVEQLLAAGDRDARIAEVQTALAVLPVESQRLWARIVRPR